MRYIGCKQKLLSEIERLIIDKRLNKPAYTFFDAFSGTGCVGEYFKDRYLIYANDIQYYSYILTQAKLNTPDMKFSSLRDNPFTYFNSITEGEEGFIWKNYSRGGSDRQYFSEENAKKIDFIRNTIEKWYVANSISKNEYYYLLACLLESISKVSNVAGVYGSFLKKWDPRAVKPLKFLSVELNNKEAYTDNVVYNEPLEKLIEYIDGDILYLDPPYTQNQYSVQYHLLETIAKYDSPEIKGKGGLRDTSETSSALSKRGCVEVAFERIIAKAKFKYIILSYSSDGLMSEKFIESVLKRYGKSETYEKREISYKTYQNHQTKSKNGHREFLFYIEKKSDKDVTFASPLNYQGGKYDLIDFIKRYLPKESFTTFIDLFGGGYNVGINVTADKIIYNDCNHKVVELIKMFRDTPTDSLIRYITSMIKKHGLAPNSKTPYLKIRDVYNAQPTSDRDPRLLYLLVLYGFNQQIRFNSSYDYNNPVGPAGFNDKMLEKLISFCRRLKEQNLTLLSCDFEDVEAYMDTNSFVYCDPPYLITLGSYNDGKRGFNGWNSKDEVRLYNFLDKLHKKGGRFMLSNVVEHKGKTNTILLEWVKKNNYHLNRNTEVSRGKRAEILITNYDIREQI